MNAQTFTQRRAIHAHNEAHRQAIHCAERVGQPEAVNFCATVEDESPPLWLLVVGVAAWTLLLVIGLGLCFIKWGIV